MLKKVIYIIISILLIAVITFFTMFMQISKRTNQVYYELLTEANNHEFDNFIKYQTLYYRQEDDVTIGKYQIKLFLTIDKLDPLISKYLIIVIPKEPIIHASKSDDNQDMTKAIVVSDKNTYDSTDLKYYGNYPISFGLTKNTFYYYSVPVYNGVLTINLYDYDGQLIFEKSQQLTIKHDNISLENDYIKSFTSKETTNLLMKNPSYLTLVYVVFGLSVATAILIGIFYYRKLDKEK